MPWNITSGEVINFAMVGVMIATLFYTRSRHRTEDTGDLQKELNDHLIECAAKHAKVEVKLENLEGTTARIERKVDNVAAQVAHLASDADDRFILTERRVKE